MTILLDGKSTAQRLQKELQKKCVSHKRPPHLFVFLSHPNQASEVYVRAKQKACLDVGIQVTVDTTQHDNEATLIQALCHCNEDPSIDGILVQLPLHPSISVDAVLSSIAPQKDVDGLHPINVGKLASGDKSGFIPCTPLGIVHLLKAYSIDLKGLHATIIGRSRIVGTPLALLLSRPWEGLNATVTLAHSKTNHLKEITLSSDVVISCVGKPHLVTADMVREGAIIVDVGINRSEDSSVRKLIGDVDFDTIRTKAAYITPVPGGVGPMTIFSLLENTYRAFVQNSSSAFII